MTDKSEFLLLDMVEQPVMVLNAQTRVLFANQVTEKLFEKSCVDCLMSQLIQLADGQAFSFSPALLRRKQPLRCVYRKGRNRRFLDVHIRLYRGEAYVVTFIDVTSFVRREQALMEEASVDSLTGIYNRRRFMTLFDKELSRADRRDDDVSFLMFDIDHFKRVNDSYGHAVGDEVLREISRVARKELREVDTFGRLGGEEFGVILPGADLRKAHVVAERLRVAVKNRIIVADEEMLNVTISVGVVSCRGKAEKEQLFKLADEALYAAKNNGRDRVLSNELASKLAEPELSLH